MASTRDLVVALGIGKANAQTGTELEETLGMPVGNTNEPTRGLIGEGILQEKLPIGSCSHGYFLIDSDKELNEVIDSLQARIDGIAARMAALREGWNKRKASKLKGSSWPK